MEIREMTCIGCPLGCMLSVELKEGKVQTVTGHTCKRGESYALAECTNPTRMVTTSIPLDDGRMVSVKTEQSIPKASVIPCMKALKGVQAKVPVRIGDIIIQNVADTGINIIATRAVV